MNLYYKLQFVLLVFATWLTPQVITSNEYEAPLYDAIEEALLVKKNVYKLRQKLFPHNRTENYFFVINLLHSRFTISNIEDDPFHPGDAFVKVDNCNCYRRRARLCGETPCEQDQIQIISTRDLQYLSYYISIYSPVVKVVDGTFYSILSKFTNHLEIKYRPDYENTAYLYDLDIKIDSLPFNPYEHELINTLQEVFSWAKYYARVGNLSGMTPREEADRSYATVVEKHDTLNDINPYSFNENVHKASLICLTVFLNLSIMLWGFYVIYYINNRTVTASSENNEDKFKILGFEIDLKSDSIIIKCIFGSTAIVLLLLNTICFAAASFLVYNEPLYKVNVIVIIFLVIFEFFVTTAMLCKIRASPDPENKIGEMCNTFMISFGCCNILWFAHRLGNCFIVSIYFIALGPSQTIAVITLCLSTITIIIASLSLIMIFCCNSNPNDVKESVKQNICNTAYIVFSVFCLIIALVFFTIIFVDLTQHGLSASEMGSILLSLSIPALIGGLTFFIKRKIEDKKAGKDTEEARMSSQ